jgi:hypothetical protein
MESILKKKENCDIVSMVKDCIEDPFKVSKRKWIDACDSILLFWDAQGRHRGKAVGLDVLFDFVRAYYVMYDYYDCEYADECPLMHPLEIHWYMRYPDEYGVDVEELRDFAYKCLNLDRYCMYFFSFLNNDEKAAEIVLELDECDDRYIRSFEQIEHVWFETHDSGLDVDDLTHPLVLFEGLLRKESFVNDLISRKIDPFGDILLFLSCEHVHSPLFNLGMVEKWYASQMKLINEFSEEAYEDEKLLKKAYAHYKAICNVPARPE